MPRDPQMPATKRPLKGWVHPANDETLAQSDSKPLREIIEGATLSRRRFLQGSFGATAMMVIGGGLTTMTAGIKNAYAAPLVGFTGITPSLAPVVDMVRVPAGYTATAFFKWGDAVVAGAPAWASDASNSAADQEKQAGMHHDGMHFFPFPSGGAGGLSSERGLLAINHEYTHDEILHVGGLLPMSLAKARKSQAAHGVSIIEVRKVGGKWTVVQNSPFGRRITGNTPMKLTGPAAGNALLKTAADPAGTDVLGTLNNCAHGFTPWGTYLTCEENFNGYFGRNGTGLPALTSLQNRYGLSNGGFGYRWHEVDARFDFNANPNEPNRHGWIVEVDPFNPRSVPVKRTALGRFKHESVEVVVAANGKVVAYSGDDERNDYLYKFVSNGTYNPANRAANMNLLDSGTLYVAKFNDDLTPGDGKGTGVWLPLIWNQNGLTPANGFADQAEVLIKARQAADRVGATMMDRPEWITHNRATRDMFLTLTNNNRRGSNPPSSNNIAGTTVAGSARPPVDEANPRADNRYGHIMRWRDDGDYTGLTFVWDIFVQCGDSLNANPNLQGNINGDDYGAPDGIWMDSRGVLWVQTDQAGNAAGDWVNIGANVMVAVDPATGETKRFLTAPPNAEVTGVIMTPDLKTMWVNIQHPGEDSTAANPTQFSAWPDLAGTRPRSATILITKNDGGIIGT